MKKPKLRRRRRLCIEQLELNLPFLESTDRDARWPHAAAFAPDRSTSACERCKTLAVTASFPSDCPLCQEKQEY